MELGCAIMTIKSKSKVGRLHEKSRMELGCALITLKSKDNVCKLNKKEQNGAGMRNDDPKD